MGLPRKLQKWVDADLISADQRTRILAHEKGKSGNLLKYGIGYIGVFSILLGFALIIGSNWQEIPDSLKLGVHFLVNAVLTALVFIWRDNPDRRIHREGALFALWGLTMTLIALIGQVFQLDGDAFSAARFWFWITTPMILYFAQGRYLTSLWAIFFVIYVPYEIFTTVIEKIESTTLQTAVSTSLSALLPIGIFLLGTWDRLRAARAAMAKTFRLLGFLWAVGIASFASMMFYSWDGPFMDFGDLGTTRIIAGVTLAGILAVGALLRRVERLDAQDHALLDIICLAGAMTCIPSLILTGNTMMGMLHFIFLWLGIGFVAQKADLDRLVNLAILLVTIRLFTGFLELFGTMMMSGFGFIVIGCVLFALLHGARVIKRKLAAA